MGFPSFVFRQIFVHPPQLPPTLSLQGQTILITGSNTGIGLEAARQCVKLEADILILAVRSISKGEAAKTDILKTNPSSHTRVEVWNLDQESIKSVNAFGKRVQTLPRLDVAILNAAVFKFDWSTSPETGFETSLQVNHLSTSLLTLYLLPILQKTSRNLKRPTRLTTTSSEVALWTPFKEREADKILVHLNDQQYFGSDHMDRYSVTKLLNMFWNQELASRISGEEVIINLVNPGSVDTSLHRDGQKTFNGKFLQRFDRILGRTPDEGGRLVMDGAVVKGSDTHGKYLSEAKLVESVGTFSSQSCLLINCQGDAIY
jgi:NAD(P)-dependent dehydrogenase (short-subunit alcohol dehydrogenase family)